MRATVAIVLCSALIVSVLFLNKKEQVPYLKLQPGLANETIPVKSPKESTSETIQLVQQYSKEIGQIQNDPVAAELKMRADAQALLENDYALLEKMILDSTLNQDDRFVALTLLSWSNNPTVASTLVGIATSPFDPLLNPNQKGDFEKILRMSAVEGLSEIPLQPDQKIRYLNQIVAKSELEPVADRAMRSLWAEQKLAKSVVDQDQEALKKLLSPP